MQRSPIRLAVPAAVLAAAALLPSGAGAVHESHHPDQFSGNTSQGSRFVLRVKSHNRVGFRVRWHADCEDGSAISEVTRIRNIHVGSQGRFFKRKNGVGVRGKIGFDPDGNPVFPEPFSFANNEAKGRVRAKVEREGRGLCRSGVVNWEASR